MDVQWTPAELRLARELRAGPRDSADIPGFAGQVDALAAADGLVRRGEVLVTENVTEAVQLTHEGRLAAQEGLPERRAWKVLAHLARPVAVAELGGHGVTDAPVAVGWLRRKGWAHIEKGPTGTVLVAGKEPGTDPQEVALARLSKGEDVADARAVKELVDRGLATVSTTTRRLLALTALGKTHLAHAREVVEVNAVTPELLAAWKESPEAHRTTTRFRRFDLHLPVAGTPTGKLHPLTRIIEEISDIFVAMGFKEIRGDFVVSAFWNMDALFIPQDHPARDMQDTFYMREPSAMPVPDAAFERVRDIHQTGGGTGSKGWQSSFQRRESERTLLRTHTTVTTLQHLRDDPSHPQKIFGVGRVFRNEAMDATHLPEFHQVEGIVTEEGADFRMLQGILREFYARMGFPDVRVRPSYYPYTEPSLDVAVPWKGKYLELGGAGIFRPEVTQSLGVTTPVLAWGLGLERLAMMRLGLSDIRALYLSDVDWLRTA